MIGLRGVGKTVLLDKMRSDAEESGFFTIRGRRLPRADPSPPCSRPNSARSCCGSAESTAPKKLPEPA